MSGEERKPDRPLPPLPMAELPAGPFLPPPIMAKRRAPYRPLPLPQIQEQSIEEQQAAGELEELLDEADDLFSTVSFNSLWKPKNRESIKGGQGSIVFVTHRNTVHTQGCAKFYDEEVDAKREYQISKALGPHDNLLTSYGSIFRDKETGKEKFIIVWEARSEDLSKKIYTVKQAEKILFPILRCLSHIHNKNYIHSDIKPANIVKSQRGIPSIVDFGFAIPVGQVAEGYTINYMSPEYAEKSLNRWPAILSTSTDLWSLGITVWEWITGSRPFDDKEPSETSLTSGLKNVEELMSSLAVETSSSACPSKSKSSKQAPASRKLTFGIQEPSAGTPMTTTSTTTIADGKDVLKMRICQGLTSKVFNDANIRLSSSEFIDFICRLLDYDPKQRGTSYALQFHPLLREVKDEWLNCKNTNNNHRAEWEQQKKQTPPEEFERKCRGSISALEGNKGSRTNPTTVPIYVVFKNKPKEKGVNKRAGGRHPECKSPTVIWVKDIAGIVSWLSSYGLSNHEFELYVCENAREAYNNGGELLIDQKLEEINCLLVLFWHK